MFNNTLKLLGTLLLLICAAVVGAQDNTAKPVITLERTACFGTCPIYTVSIFADGTVVYNGENHVTVTGEQTSTIDPEIVEEMVEAFEDAGYFTWNDAYTTQTVSDLPSAITSVTLDGKTHTINRYAGDSSAPLALPFLENWIDTMAVTSLWTGAQQDIANISDGTNTPFATLERTACFGFCPVYSVALYESGTIVYTGIANVDELGVEVLQADPASLTSIAMRAQAIGYFGWEDAYDFMAITDQVTVITSVRWEDEFKRIVRYDGDPNAPVGVVWVEDMIDQTIADVLD